MSLPDGIDENPFARPQPGSLGGRSDLNEDDDGADWSDVDGDDAILSSPYGTVIKDLMKRLLKVSSHVKSWKDKIDNWAPRQGISSLNGEQNTQSDVDTLRNLMELYSFLWGRLLKVLFDENERYGEIYSRTLDIQDRAPFESLTHTIHHNTDFCDLMGEIIDASYEREPYDDEDGTPEEKRLLLMEYSGRMEAIQMSATFCGVLVVEGSRESFLDPVAMEDLCKTVVEEQDRRRRLIHLSLMFSMLAQDEQSVTEVLIQGVDRVILQRFRHLTHRLYSLSRDVAPHPGRQRKSPLQSNGGRGRDVSEGASRRGSPQRSRKTSPSPRAKMNTVTTVLLPPPPVPPGEMVDPTPVSPLPVPPSTGTFPHLDLTRPSASPLGEEALQQRQGAAAQDEGPSGQSRKWQRTERNWPTNERCDEHQRWVPAVGETVARGPGWAREEQASHCDFGKVVGFTDKMEVVVQWKRSADARLSRHQDDRQFRYSYSLPSLEVVPIEYYLRSQTRNADKDTLRIVEFMLTAAITGVLCQQPETVLPSFQFQTLETALQVLDTVDLPRARAVLQEARERAKYQQEGLFGHPEQNRPRAHLENVRQDAREHMAASDMSARMGCGNERADGDSKEYMTKAMEWSPELQSAEQATRDQRDRVARVLWVLNGLLSHKKLCIRFLELSGLTRIQKLIATDSESVSTVLGCTIVLAHLAKHAVFEELLRNHVTFFVPMMDFILTQWEKSPNSEIRTRAGAFLHHTLSFPYTLHFFDHRNGAASLLDSLSGNVKASEEQFDVLNPGVQLGALKCLNTYITSHLMLSTKVVFRKHRVLSTVITNASPYTSLPRDPGTVESVLGYLWSPSNAIPDTSAENVYGLLTQDRLTPIHKLMESGLHHVLLHCTNFYFIQSRWELLAATLQGLCVLTVVPYIRHMIAEPRPNESAIPLFLVIVGDLAASYNNGNTSRENHLLPCVLSALQILVQVTTPPTDHKDEAQVSACKGVCEALRAHDGVRILLDLLKIKKDSSLSAKLHFFPVIARGVQLMVVLKCFGNTSQLFEALGVHRVAQDLLQEYGPAQREYISMMGQRKLLTELDPADRFMENVKWLMPQAFGESYQVDTVRAPPVDPVEMEMRRAIIAKAEVDYAQKSLLSLMVDHLEAEGLHSSAAALRHEAGLRQGVSGSAQNRAVASETTAVTDPSETLDGIVRSYLRQQQERCPNPIETLPLFDLTKRHLYVPPPPPPDPSRNAFDRQLARKTNAHSLRSLINDNCLVYRNPAFVFDIMSEGDLQGDSICFCDGGDAIITGTSDGSIYVFDTFPEEIMDKLLEQHIVFENEGITSLVMSPNEEFLGVINERYDMKIMPRSSLPVVRHELTNCRAARFSHDNAKLLVTSGDEHICALTDLATQQRVAQFSDRVWSGENSDNVALFDATSTLVLHDAVLWDLRCSSRPVFRFDRITESFASAFHPSNQKVIIDEKVWDMRMLQIMQTVPVFRKTSSFHTNQLGKVIYGFREAKQVVPSTTSIVSAVDSYSFEVIFSEEVQPTFRAFALDPSDRYCAAILEESRDCPVRIFSTASGPYPDRRAFAAPAMHGGPDENEGGSEEDEEEDEAGDWSLSDDLDDDDMESSASYSEDGSLLEEEPDDAEDSVLSFGGSSSYDNTEQDEEDEVEEDEEDSRYEESEESEGSGMIEGGGAYDFASSEEGSSSHHST